MPRLAKTATAGEIIFELVRRGGGKMFSNERGHEPRESSTRSGHPAPELKIGPPRVVLAWQMKG